MLNKIEVARIGFGDWAAHVITSKDATPPYEVVLFHRGNRVKTICEVMNLEHANDLARAVQAAAAAAEEALISSLLTSYAVRKQQESEHGV